MQISSSIENNRTFFQKKLRPDISFDVVDRNLMIGGRDACLYCIDGFTKDDTLLKVLQAMSSIETAQMPDNANDFAALYLAYGEIGLETDSDALIIQLLSGVPFLLIDGYAQALTIDCRTYPARGVSEPEKDKVLRGSRDGFVETLVFNTALIRRRIRDPKLRMEIMNIGESSHTDIAICYMENRVDTELLNRIRTRIQKVHVDALSMNQESLAECIYPHKWFNPFPKFRFSERPDTSAASILEGNIINPEIDTIRTITTKQDRNPNSGNLYFDSGIEGKGKFRYLTPRECMLFMGFKDMDYWKLKNNNVAFHKGDQLFSRDKIIRMAGNSIPVKLLEGVFWQILQIDKLMDKDDGCSQ